MIDIVKLANGNVAIYDSTSGDFINSLSPDIVEIECNVNGSVKIVQDNGSVEYIDPATVQNTEVVPAAAIPFSGDCADLAQLLSTDFFFVVSGGGASDLSTVLGIGNSAGLFDIDLNNNDLLNTDKIDFNLATTDTAGIGELVCNDSLGTLNLGLKGGNTISNVGQHIHARVVNKTVPLVRLTKAGYEVVIVSGATGQRLSVKLARADNDANSAGTLGIVCENIAGNQEGFICSVGQVTNINTTGSLQGETWADGDSLYLSGTTFGAITNVKPSAPIHEVRIGYVEYAHAVNGKIYVKIDNGYELDELHNVDINTGTLANNDALIYESSTQLWKNKTIATALGFTPTTNARNITINGTTQNLSADRTYTVTDANLSTSDITTNNVSTTKHGFTPKAPVTNGAYLEVSGTAAVWTGLVYTVELMDALTVDFYAPYDLKINTTTNIKNAPTITIQDDGVAYTLTNTIAIGSKITVTASVAGVTNLNITKA